MITIKDFKKGDKVFILHRSAIRKAEPTITEREVYSVGRTYVTIGTERCWQSRYMNWDTEYLREKVDYGEPSLLFKIRKDAEQYVEKCDLALWLGLLSVSEANNISHEKLKKVKEILCGIGDCHGKE